MPWGTMWTSEMTFRESAGLRCSLFSSGKHHLVNRLQQLYPAGKTGTEEQLIPLLPKRNLGMPNIIAQTGTWAAHVVEQKWVSYLPKPCLFFPRLEQFQARLAWVKHCSFFNQILKRIMFQLKTNQLSAQLGIYAKKVFPPKFSFLHFVA